LTIALGLIGSGGLIFAADTEESWGEHGDIKTANTKIYSASRFSTDVPLSAIAISGSGDADYLQAVKLELLDAVFKRADWQYEQHGNMTEAFLIEFYKKHIVPFWPNSPDFELLIGLNRAIPNGSLSSIWATTKTIMKPCIFGYEAVGTGRAYATALLSRFHSMDMDLNACAMLAIHIIHSVKEFIGGCGKQTQVVVLSNGTNRLLDQRKVDEAERLLGHVLILDAHLLRFVLSSSADFSGISQVAHSLRDELQTLNLFSQEGPPHPESTTGDPSSPPPSPDSPGETGES
jgi:hypothetical protein